ncbi:RluA family pseudouridine synthase [Coprothermobacter platensis]|uniref:RluA family pseudouridine synthase n=1 Tax=Coprothermobacter platensis TaxID=108819 RepID=UPI0003755DAD|nr:RluA family pseudouridine synthase [Coprothermobacter platensis]
MGDEAVRVISGIADLDGRLDIALMDLIDDEGISRSWVQRCIKSGLVQVNGKTAEKSSQHVHPGDRLQITLEPRTTELLPMDVAYEVVYRDQYMAVVNKPPHLVVHPAPSVRGATLCHGLLKDFPEIKDVGSPERPGIVHRLDKDTSGLMLVALNIDSYMRLIKMIASKEVIRKYLVAVLGKVDAPFQVNAPIGRDERNPTRMAVTETGKFAYTSFKPLAQASNNVTLLEASLGTGRTHQIRVHLRYRNLYVLGDETYGNAESSMLAPRVFLHSYFVQFQHPITGEVLCFTCPLPDDLKNAWDNLGGDSIVYPSICA